MTGAEHIAYFLHKQGVTDVFGIPGGVILDLLYAFDKTLGITPHLCYHEQTAGFAALGYAQSSRKLGVAYATKGPGFTNLLTPIADAYFDSVPVLFLTAHTSKMLPEKCRLITDQEFDTCSMVKGITKYAQRIDSISSLATDLAKACEMALEGRQGPVFLDISVKALKAEIDTVTHLNLNQHEKSINPAFIADAIKEAKRPVILVGDGVNQSQQQTNFQKFATKAKLPILSSRYSHNLMNGSPLYFGYIGSHGIRYANFILSKSDLIISIGNRLYFPVSSDSYRKLTENTKIIRLDIDSGELTQPIPNTTPVKADLTFVMPMLASMNFDFGNHNEWLKTCDIIKDALWNVDVSQPVQYIYDILQKLPDEVTIVGDVGNNEFWLSRACILAQSKHHTLYSKSFGALGNAIGKAIGAYYATRHPVIAFTGDQGFQLNIQELQYISQHNLPITIVILNNHSSGMIRDREAISGFKHSLHTTESDGYATPDFAEIAHAYNLKWSSNIRNLEVPQILEIKISCNETLFPYLPKGHYCQDMMPALPFHFYEKLNNL